jgi:cation diffusion facilitator family transporter
VVLVVVIAIKEILFRYVLRANRDIGSLAIHADAWHHRSDAITSAAAFVGITLTLVGGPDWGSADGYAALVASLVIVVNGVRTLRPAVADLMDRAPAQDLVERVARTAESVSDVQAIEKVLIRKAGIGYFVDLHVQADPEMTLNEAHVLSGRVKSALRQADSRMLGALIHMEPYEAADGAIPRAPNS